MARQNKRRRQSKVRGRRLGGSMSPPLVTAIVQTTSAILRRFISFGNRAASGLVFCQVSFLVRAASGLVF